MQQTENAVDSLLLQLSKDLQEHISTPRRPRWKRAFWVGLTSTRYLFIDILAVVIGLIALLAGWIAKLGTAWVSFGFFMAGVCVVLKITQRVQLACFNQTMVWLGAPEPPLDVERDEVAVFTEVIQVLFQAQAVAMIYLRGF